MTTTVKTTKYTYKSSTGGTSGSTDVTMEYGTDIGAFTRLEDKIRLLQEDLEFERELRQKIEREKSDLTVHLMQLSERLDEAEGSSESQSEMNKKRDTELSKLRKLLEDVHLESEETAHHLRKKHQEAILELQDQLDQSNKHRAKIEKEKQKYQAEVYDLLAQVETAHKDKLSAQKTVEKLEVTIHEMNIRIEELNRTVTEITAQRSRLSSENSELMKEVQEYKVSLDNVNHIKTQLATQLEDLRRKYEDEERRRSLLESTVHTLEMDVESYKTQLDEESEARIDLERQLVKANGECATYKTKYETECLAHADEVEELRRKITQKTAEYEEQLEALLNKCSSLEKAKSRLQSEVEVLVMDLEKATSHVQVLEKRITQIEKINIELKTKLEEVTQLYEGSQRDLKGKIADLQKAMHENEKLRDQLAALTRENKKLTDELNDAKAHLSDASRRIHDMDIEIKRLENEREELSIAYREAETLRKQEEAKAQRLSSELASVRHEYERRLTAKEEELEALRKQMAIEMDQLSQRLAEAEAKVKTEVARIKKKMQVQITELEMSLDVANKQNIDMQKTIKIQSTKITELQSHYDEVTRQLQQSLDQLGVSQRRCQALTAELEELRVTLEQTQRSKRAIEQSLDESQSKVSELNTLNVNLTSAKSKLENEFLSLHNDYEEISKELRVSDERYNRVVVELKSTKDLLVEEQERIVKIESIKKSLEVEVRNLQIRIEEVETNALAGGRRVISKLESRIRDIELELDEEKKRHAETQKMMRKKEHRVKELLLQTEEDHKTITMLNDAVEKLTEKVKVYKRQLSEQEGMTQQNLTRVRRFQRELEAAEDRAEQAESNLSFIRSRHRTIVTGPAAVKQVFVTTTEESSSSSMTQNY
ncbi:paramyosin-like isoform X1 [Stegodyphus dumicola]|uniref:paramyosin-like isoform X1 n=2 Tax=Stegodyphus dumicola TaxID=202533 RepID=UPI0015A85E7E|nr:paramyosin-like isoform X1 [Stegodyphus dumicola]